ncbi:MAG: aminoacyl-tRNA hydrolase [Oscillospiraceae bacterium]|nr:aminoacyl-tRNA hydrolase [Oscillospiraceae bacterium]
MFFRFNKNKKEFDSQNKIKYIVAGLGNPGNKYLQTRHNAGFLALDYISGKYNFKINIIKFKSLCAAGPNVLYMKPQTYMNNSGEAVSEAARFYKIPAENILVISDDASLPTGKIRIRKSGSDGGQKGLRSIIYNLSCDEFPRIKIGVGEKPHPDFEMSDWVTSEFTKPEQKIIFEALEKVSDCVDLFLKDTPVEQIQNKYN